MSFVTEIGYMKMRGVYKKVSKYARNQASGFVTYSLKKGGYFVFKKKVGGLYWVTWVTFSIKSIKSILLGHFLRLHLGYMKLHFQFNEHYQRFLRLHDSYILLIPYARLPKNNSIKKYVPPYISTIEEYYDK
jgi:hypothetical protein